MNQNEKYGFLIPVYNHGKEVHGVLKNLSSHALPVIIVDDGSDQKNKEYLQEACKLYQNIELVILPRNTGKGGAVSAGIKHAYQQGYSHVFQVDADGQHDTSCCTDFLEMSRQNPEAMICGEPVYDHTIPSSRQKGRKIGNLWAKIVACSSDIRDAMCGFRIYPVTATYKIITKSLYIDMRMGFDLEILVRLKWKNIPFIYLPVRTTYPQDGVSHFHFVRDNIRIVGMFTRAFFGMVLRSPLLLARKITGKGK